MREEKFRYQNFVLVSGDHLSDYQSSPDEKTTGTFPAQQFSFNAFAWDLLISSSLENSNSSLLVEATISLIFFHGGGEENDKKRSE
jgi:hypothetical protein